MKTLLNHPFVLQAEFRWLIRFLGALVEQDNSISVSVCVLLIIYIICTAFQSLMWPFHSISAVQSSSIVGF